MKCFKDYLIVDQKAPKKLTKDHKNIKECKFSCIFYFEYLSWQTARTDIPTQVGDRPTHKQGQIDPLTS